MRELQDQLWPFIEKYCHVHGHTLIKAKPDPRPSDSSSGEGREQERNDSSDWADDSSEEDENMRIRNKGSNKRQKS